MGAGKPPFAGMVETMIDYKLYTRAEQTVQEDGCNRRSKIPEYRPFLSDTFDYTKEEVEIICQAMWDMLPPE